MKKFILLWVAYMLVFSAYTQSELTVCSFNIQFLGSFKKRDAIGLADILKMYDIVLIQELVAPPVKGKYPDGNAYKADEESLAFLNAMTTDGFQYHLSNEDTGPGEKIHIAGTRSEWFIVFYKANGVNIATDLPNTFIDEDRSNNKDYDRVPYAFSFRTVNKKLDFTLISVHLHPDDSKEDSHRRAHELQSIATWVDEHSEHEKDMLIIGDMNINDKEELTLLTTPGFLSLNDECRRTNTNINKKEPHEGAKPYDHIMYRTAYSKHDLDLVFDMQVIDLVAVMKPYWHLSTSYPGTNYDHNLFKQYYSDHHPVIFKFKVKSDDDQ